MERERLDQAVVSAAIQRRDSIFQPASAGEHQYRQTGHGGPHLCQQLYAIEFGEIQVQNKEVVVGLTDGLEGSLAVVDHIHGVFVGLEPTLQEVRERNVVFSD